MRFVHSASSRRFGIPWVGMVALMGCSDTAAVPASKDAGPDAQASIHDAQVDAAASGSSSASSAPSVAEAGASSSASVTLAASATADAAPAASQSVDSDADASQPDVTLDAEASVMSIDDAGDAGDAAMREGDSETGALQCVAVGVSELDAALPDAGANCFPSCVQELEAACPTTGSCTHSCDGTSAAWENGVTLSTYFDAAPPYTLESTVSLASGGLCYRVVHESEPETYSWFDSCGVLVAYGTPFGGDAGASVLNVVCQATGIAEQVHLDSGACARYAGGAGVPEFYYGCDLPSGCEF